MKEAAFTTFDNLRNENVYLCKNVTIYAKRSYILLTICILYCNLEFLLAFSFKFYLCMFLFFIFMDYDFKVSDIF